ncbi:MAG: 50S ribosomal protein L11 methyltransferase [Syntrophobacteraceae bacterium]
MKMGKNWVHVVVACEPETVDDLAAHIAEGLRVGVEVGERSVQFYLEEDGCTADWERELQEILDDFRTLMRVDEPLSFTCSKFLEEDWAERWKVHFKPLRVGRRFIVSPTWEKVDSKPGDRVIRINPGRAFGTGHHETTRLCLQWMEEWEKEAGSLEGKSLLDVGTGSAILAIGAALMGCRPVVGVDNDPEAIEVATEDIEINGLNDVLELKTGTAGDVKGVFDAVVANIQAFPLIDMAHVLTKRVKSGGALALSGILTEQGAVVRAAYEQEGLSLLYVKDDGEWRLLAFRKP